MASDIPFDIPATDVPAPRTRRLPLIIAGVVIAGVVVWGGNRYLYGRHHVTSDNAQLDGHITIVAPKVQAFVARVLVDDNQHVKAGDTLIVLDERDLRVRLQQADADLASALAAAGSSRRAGQAQAQVAVGRAQAAGAEATVVSAEAAQRKATADLDRYRGLAAQKIVSAQQLDAAQAAYDAANANLDAARKQATAAGSQVAAFSAALTGADARLEAARAAVENARLQLSYTVITAPVEGVIAKRNAESGALVQIGQSLMSVVPENDVWVTANLKETELADVRVGDSAEFSVDAYPGVKFHGRVESLSPATGARFALLPPDNATGNFTKVVQRIPVRIAVDAPADSTHPLRPGMSVVVTIATKA